MIYADNKRMCAFHIFKTEVNNFSIYTRLKILKSIRFLRNEILNTIKLLSQ